jgi:hemerythrin-like domain-containing protein
MGALIQARKLQRAADGSVSDCRNAIAEFIQLWRAEIQAHFDEEERLLLPLIDAPELRQRLLDEHRNLRAMGARCECQAEGVAQEQEFVRRLGKLLNDHVRWEERVLFEVVQRDHPEALTMLLSDATGIEKKRSRARRQNYADLGPR